ncbi:MAG: 2-oxo acid dehydrogenase subunit E2 [Methyloligellaceae bacterium]
MEVLMPQLGETVAEGKISTWFKNVGDKIEAGDTLFEVETDKATMEVEATQSGFLTNVNFSEGETAAVGTVIAVISDSADAAGNSSAQTSKTEQSDEGDTGGAEDILMPQLGETVAEGKISAWYKSVGDQVAAGEKLFEVETDKATMEVEATVAGILSDIVIQEGEAGPVGAIVARIGGGAGSSSAKHEAPKQTTPSIDLNRFRPTSQPASGHLDPFNEVKTPALIRIPGKIPDGIKMTPVAKRMIQANGVDAVRLSSSVLARGGSRIAKKDVVEFLNSGQATSIAAAKPEFLKVKPGPNDEVVELNRFRKITAERLATSWQTAPHVYQAVEINFTSLNKTRLEQKDSYKQRHGTSLTFLPFIVRATAMALRDFPHVNAKFDGENLVVGKEINVGIAIDLDGNGLVVPVIHNTDEMNVPGIASAINRLVEKAQESKLAPSEFEGGTYTISNNGSFNTLMTTPIINAPQVAILSTDTIRKRPIIVGTGDDEKIVPGLLGVVGQCFDHRAFDGAYSARFLNRLREIIETRDWSRDFD